MKKLILTILLGIFISSGVLFAYSNPQLEKGLDTLGKVMDQKFSSQEQLEKYSTVVKVLKPLLKKKSGKQKKDFQLILSRMEQQVRVLSKKLTSQPLSTNQHPKKTTENLMYYQAQKNNLPNVDIQKIQQTWLDRHNAERKKLGLPTYILHEKLNYSSFTWAKHLSSVKTYTHQRKSTDGFYNYQSISDWFSNLGVQFNGKGTLFTESISLGKYSCHSSDCTDTLIKGIRKNFNFFMSEAKYKQRRKKAHYRAIVHSYFNMIGVGIYQKNGKYYLVSHYGRNVK